MRTSTVCLLEMVHATLKTWNFSRRYIYLYIEEGKLKFIFDKLFYFVILQFILQYVKCSILKEKDCPLSDINYKNYSNFKSDNMEINRYTILVLH